MSQEEGHFSVYVHVWCVSVHLPSPEHMCIAHAQYSYWQSEDISFVLVPKVSKKLH